MNPSEYYSHLVQKHGVAKYLAPRPNQDQMNGLFQKMGLHVDETTSGRILREFVPRGRLPILEYLTEAVYERL